MIEHVQQPEGSKLCGHSVLAMVRGIPLDEAVKRMGHGDRGTRTRELVKALGSQALYRRLTVIGRRPLLEVPDPCVLKVCWPEKSRSHFVLRVGYLVHDPLYAAPVDILEWTGLVARGRGRITSYLPVRLP